MAIVLKGNYRNVGAVCLGMVDFDRRFSRRIEPAAVEKAAIAAGRR